MGLDFLGDVCNCTQKFVNHLSKFEFILCSNYILMVNMDCGHRSQNDYDISKETLSISRWIVLWQFEHTNIHCLDSSLSRFMLIVNGARVNSFGPT